MKLTPNFYRDRVCLNVLASCTGGRALQKLPGRRQRGCRYA